MTKIKNNNQYLDQDLYKKQADNTHRPSGMQKIVLEATVHNRLQRIRSRRRRRRRRRKRRSSRMRKRRKRRSSRRRRTSRRPRINLI
jgi:hypothetical protein